VLFSEFSNYLQTIENLDSRLAMTQVLADLFAKLSADEIDKVCYLSLGMLKPKFIGLELQIAEKMMIRALAQVLRLNTQVINAVFKETGDLCSAAHKLAQLQKLLIHTRALTITQVYNELVLIAQENGIGSQDRKVSRIVKLLGQMDEQSITYLVRIPLKKLRLGFSDMTILDGLSWMQTGNKSLRPQLEQAYNIRADIGQIAQIFKSDGLAVIEKIEPQTGTPIVPSRATPLLDPTEILEKMQGKCALEPKFDGFRVQIHIDKSKQFHSETGNALGLFTEAEAKPYVEIFSRNMDNMTYMFPDLVAAAQALPVSSAILDGEALAFNPKTGESLDFQETVKRKRKHNIESMKEEIPLRAYIFDVIYLNQQSLISLPLEQRRKQLEMVFGSQQNQTLQLAQQKIVNNPEAFQTFFESVASDGLEGVMAKKLDAPYKAGARDFTWVKYKVGMQSSLADTVDAIVMGYFKGQGKWTQFGLGKILVGVPDENGKILSISKVGSGFSEKSIIEMVKRCQKIEISQPPIEYVVDKSLIPDIWVKPEILVEIRADSISRSTLYTTALSLRFPRFIRFRDDKQITEATTLRQVQDFVKKD